MKKLIAFVLIVSAAAVACKEDGFEITVEGRIFDESLGGSLSSADVVISTQTVNGGVFSSTYSPLVSTVTDGSGNFSMEVTKINVPDYQIEASRDQYFSREITINADDFQPGETYVRNMTLYAQADVTFHLQNTSPLNEFDEITIQNVVTDFDCTCCNNAEREFGGTDVDTSVTCSLYGESWLKYFVQVDKDTLQYNYLDSVFCPAFENTVVTIEY